MTGVAQQAYVRLAGAFGTADIDRLLRALAPLDALAQPTIVTVDLHRLGWISAPAVAVLVSTLLGLDASGMAAPGSTILAPRRLDVLERLRELEVLDLLAGNPPAAALHRLGRGSRPCRRFTAEEEPGEVAQELTDALTEVCRSDGPARNAIWYALNEITQNVKDHADAPGGGVAVAEVARGGTELVVAIADHGVGIRKSLARNPDYRALASDLEALRTALLPGVTGRRDSPGGLGLTFTHILLHGSGGGLAMRSGTAHLEVGATPAADFHLMRMRGTLVTLRFRTDQPLSLDLILRTTQIRGAVSTEPGVMPIARR